MESVPFELVIDNADFDHFWTFACITYYLLCYLTVLPGKADVQLWEGTADINSDHLVNTGLEACQGGLWRDYFSIFSVNIISKGTYIEDTK